MSEIASPASPRFQWTIATVAAGALGFLVVAAGLLWASYGGAVFYEIILAGLNACF